MTGTEFKEAREGLGLTLRGLAHRWDVDKRTIHREERKRKVRGLYEDAIRRVQNELDSE
jgi:DNA-binding transcriptional regulator YiaG